MASEPIRDPKKDHLLTPQNAAFIVIDYQPVQVNSIASMDRQLLVNHIVGASRAAVAYGLPIVHSTVNVKTGLNKPPIPQLRKVLDAFPTYDRTTINSWEDVEFRKAVEATEVGADTFQVWGDGSHSRGFLYVDDFARGLIEVAASGQVPGRGVSEIFRVDLV